MYKQSEHIMEIGDMNVYYRAMGHGRPLILLHGGWATGKMNWSAHLDILAKHYQVILPDLRGHGKTNNPTAGFDTYGHLAWEMIAFVEQLNLPEKPIIVGHSSGGLVSLHMSIYQPELLAGQVLIGISPHNGKSTSFKHGMEQFFNTTDFRNPPSKLAFMCRHPLWSLALWQAHDSPWFELLNQSWPMWIKPLELEFFDYQKISIPTLLVHGDNDEFGSVHEADNLLALIPGARLEIVENADHMFVVSKPRQLQTIMLPFLQKIA